MPACRSEHGWHGNTLYRRVPEARQEMLRRWNFANHRNVAFTLAEVLITLGIIGVVAAMTLPGIMAHYKKQVTISKLKKVYTTLNQTYMRSYEDNGEPENISTLTGEEYLEKYWQPYMNKSKYCKTAKACGYSSNTPFVNVKNTSDTTNIVWEQTRTTFYVPDGTVYSIWYASRSVGNRSYQIIVDINGSQKPNRYGEDVFFFSRVPQKRAVLGYGYSLSDADVNSNCQTIGAYCTEKIIRAGWEFEPDYPISFR